MKKVLLAVLAALLLCGPASAGRHDALPLHQGSAGPRVAALQWLLAGHRPNVFTKVKNPYVTNADSREPGTILTDPNPVPAWPYSFTLDPTSKVAAIVATQAGPN